MKQRLGEIEISTLVITGEHDEIGPEISRDIADSIPNAQLHIVEEAGHGAFWEQPEEYIEDDQDFLLGSIGSFRGGRD